MGKIGYKTQYFIIILLLFISLSCAKYGEYSKCGNEPETALEGLYKEYSDGNFEQAQQYLSKVDSTYYSDLKNELGEEYFHEKMKLNSFLAQNTTWTVKNKNFNKDGLAQMTLVIKQPDIQEIGKAYGETIANVLFNSWNCENDECISKSSEKLNLSAIIKDKGPFEFVTTEEEYDFVCEDNLWKVDYKLNLRKQIADEIVEVGKLYYIEGKTHEAVRRLKEIPLKYKIDEYDEDLVELILDSIEKKEASKELENEQ